MDSFVALGSRKVCVFCRERGAQKGKVMSMGSIQFLGLLLLLHETEVEQLLYEEITCIVNGGNEAYKRKNG